VQVVERLSGALSAIAEHDRVTLPKTIIFTSNRVVIVWDELRRQANLSRQAFTLVKRWTLCQKTRDISRARWHIPW
jgi:hypothetical protein